MRKLAHWISGKLPEPKVATGYFFAVLAFVFLLLASLFVGLNAWLNLLLLLFGLLLGWITGMLASPLNSHEMKRFATFAAGISSFLSGFVVAKIDKIFETRMEKGVPTADDVAPALILCSAFLLGMLCTFVARSYVGKPKPPNHTPGRLPKIML